ncbi:MAG: dTDP-4-dehydrorhamnose reductase [Moraxella sp.]|nr:dTDP-4-dehydrorhamnose reductase [Moraxella sp.]
MKLLLLGKNGQVGYELVRALSVVGELLSLDRHINQDGLGGDITDFKIIQHTIDNYKPDIIINATAYTAVDKAESEKEHCNLVNNLAVAHLAKYAKDNNTLLIHYSTDYVFDGTSDKPWQETDNTNPINFYGLSKRNGEIALENSGANFINLRTSWVYGIHGNNFIKTMLNLGKTKDELNIIDDQYGTPTSASLIADITAHIIYYLKIKGILKTDQLLDYTGHYHLAPKGVTTWYEFAKIIFDNAKTNGKQLSIKNINPIPTIEYPTPANRPLNSRLNTQKIQHTFGVYLPQWQDHAIYTILEIINDN